MTSQDRVVQTLFDSFKIQRHAFAQSITDFSQKPEYGQLIIDQGGMMLLQNLLTDVNPAIQQNGCIAVERISGHDPNIANMMIKQDIVRVLLYFNMEKANKHLKRAALMAIRSVVKHSSDMSRSVIDIGGLDQVVASLSDFDPGVKEAAGMVCACIAKHDADCAQAIISAGAVTLLVLCLQQPEPIVRSVASNALSEISKHSPETAQSLIGFGAISHLVRAISSIEPKLKRQAMNALANIAKHSEANAKLIIGTHALQNILGSCGHPDELVRKSACGLIKEIVKHSPELAQLIVRSGKLRLIVNAVVDNCGETKLHGIMALGFISGHSPALAMAVVNSEGTNALSLALNESEIDSNSAAAAAWALGHIARHSPEHARYVSTCGILPRILEIYMSPNNPEEMKDKAKQALKMILLKTDDLEHLEPLLSTAPQKILKYVVAQYSKVLPRDPAARRAFVDSGGLSKLQELLVSEDTGGGAEGFIVREHISLINQCFPEDVVKFYSPDYPQTLLESIEKYCPEPPIKINPALWTKKLFSDTKIPPELNDEILELQELLQNPPHPVVSEKASLLAKSTPSVKPSKMKKEQSPSKVGPKVVDGSVPKSPMGGSGDGTVGAGGDAKVQGKQ